MRRTPDPSAPRSGVPAVDGVRIAWRRVPAGAERRDISRALLRELLRGATGADAEFSQTCPACGGPHGPVLVAGGRGPLVSVAYAADLAVAAVAPPGARAFGIDAEPDDERRRAAVREATGSPAVADWTRIEAVAKARGTGLRGDFAALRLADAPAGWGDTGPAGDELSKAASDTGEGSRLRRWRVPADGAHSELRGFDIVCADVDAGTEAATIVLSVALGGSTRRRPD